MMGKVSCEPCPESENCIAYRFSNEKIRRAKGGRYGETWWTIIDDVGGLIRSGLIVSRGDRHYPMSNTGALLFRANIKLGIKTALGNCFYHSTLVKAKKNCFNGVVHEWGSLRFDNSG